MATEGYAIELYFDPALEMQIISSWNVLARTEISTNLVELQSRPHIDLFISTTPSLLEPSHLQNLLKTFASQYQPLSLTFSSIGSFPNDEGKEENDVVFFLPTPSVSLLQFQSQLCDMLKREGIEIDPEYCMDSWVPYCFVQLQIPKEKLVEAFCVLKDLKMTPTGSAVSIRLVEFKPERGGFSPDHEVFSCVLGNNDGNNADQQ